jgi:hypothetical protein
VVLFNPVAAAAAARLYAMVLDPRCVGGGAKRCNGLIKASLFFRRIGKDAGAGHLERSSAICRPFDIIFG